MSDVLPPRATATAADRPTIRSVARRGLLLRPLLAGALAALAGPALADPCVISGNTATCSGQPDLPFAVNGFYSVTVSDLSADLAPAAGTGIVVMTNTGDAGVQAPEGQLVFDDAGHGFTTSGASGLVLTLAGGNGGFGGQQGGMGNFGQLSVTAGTVSVSGAGAVAGALLSKGGDGGAGLYQPETPDHDGVIGGASGPGGGIAGLDPASSLQVQVTQMTLADGAAGFIVTADGGAGGSVPSSDQTVGGTGTTGSAGGDGGAGGTLEARATLGSVTLNGAGTAVISARSSGGQGGDAGAVVAIDSVGTGGSEKGLGASGGVGGAGGDVHLDANLTVQGTVTPGFAAVLAESRGGNGGNGSDVAGNSDSISGAGGAGGAGGSVQVGGPSGSNEFLTMNVALAGDQSHVLVARSYGGAGGNGGTLQNSFGTQGPGGAAAGGGDAGSVFATVVGTASTAGSGAGALILQSVGGFAGTGADAYGAGGQSHGDGGTVTLGLTAQAGAGGYGLLTTGDQSDAVVAQSVGGGGGSAFQTLGLTGLGGANLAGGNGNTVTLSLSGTVIATQGTFSRGVFADSIGGGGGSGGPNTTISSIGAAGGTGGNGGAVNVAITNAVQTAGSYSDGIVASSIGGGGGSAVSADNLFRIGGDAGGGGGNGGAVTVALGGGVATQGISADGVFAQSIGGGGGDGANTVATGLAYVQAIGGKGGTAGTGGNVSVSDLAGASGAITTTGDQSRGVFVQSLGGGGGSGGSAVTAGVLTGFSLGIGGDGGGGGSAGTATVALTQDVTTSGQMADAVMAQSIGGGGGAGGGVVNANFLTGVDVTTTVGGSGKGGGDAGAVTVTTSGAIRTSGAQSAGIVAQATGGGGGHSGMIVANTSLALSTIGVTVGGQGGKGGSALGTVTVTANGSVATTGMMAEGIVARSTGGGGGDGKMQVATQDLQISTINVAVGSKGGDAGNAGDVVVVANSTVSTQGVLSNAITAVSTGGGGGSAGGVLQATGFTLGDIGVTLGGSGGSGGTAGAVTVTTSGDISTGQFLSDGIYAASIGGKGGDAGLGLVQDATVNVGTVGGVTLALGGDGGPGGTGGAVSVTTANSITTQGLMSDGIMAQSVGGDGGRARMTVAGDLVDVGAVNVAVGGSGGDGGAAGTVSVLTQTAGTVIQTSGIMANGIEAQSLGGHGGAGGYVAEGTLNVGGDATDGLSGEAGVTVGGGGAPGGRGGAVTVGNVSAITVGGYSSTGIMAQSIGGNGGNGGNVYSFNADVNASAAINVNVNVGADAGFGTASSTVGVTNTGAITTLDYLSPGILAQSVGGNGGNGGSSFAGLLQLASSGKFTVNADVGGYGGGGGNADAVTVKNSGDITTKLGGSDAISAQSIGGGGGRGGNAGYIGADLSSPIAQTSTTPSVTFGFTLGVGGGAGNGATAGAVNVTNSGAILTFGDRARGIFAQSVGGGGGDGGTASSTSFALSDICNNATRDKYICQSKVDPTKNEDGVSLNLSLTMGGTGGGGGDGNAVTVNNTGSIATDGQLSHAIYAQSVGGGGGIGGEGALGVEAWTSNQAIITATDLPSNVMPSFSSIDIVLGASGGGGGNGGAVQVTNAGALSVSGPVTFDATKYTGYTGVVPNMLSFVAGGTGIFAQSVGGGGGDGGAGSSGFSAVLTIANRGGGGGNGGAVTVNNTGSIVNTSGFSGTGIFAQSVGGGGGKAGDVGLAFSDPGEYANIGAGLAIALSPGAGGDGGTVTVSSGGLIHTTGVASDGIVAQSVGGSGGIAATQDDAKTTIFVGSGNAPGNGGDVSVTADAPITVDGAGSVGVVALSAGGAASGNTSGAVTVNVNAAITAGGQRGAGLLASSNSYQNQATGDVTINVNQGGSVSTGATGGAAVTVLSGGANSAINNAGTIATANPGGYAISVQSANVFSIANAGTLTGSVQASSISEGGTVGQFFFDNVGTFNSGTSVNIGGIGSVVRQEGTIAPGGSGSIASTTITANSIFLTGGSIYDVDFDPSTQVAPGVASSDLLTLKFPDNAVGPLVYVAPTIVPNPVGGAPLQRSGVAYILNAAQSFDTSLVTVNNTATAQYTLSTTTSHTPGMTTLVLGYTLDPTPWDGALSGSAGGYAGLNANHQSFGVYLDHLLFSPPAGADHGLLAGLAQDVLGAPTPSALLALSNGYIADEALAVPDSSYLAGLAFSDELHSCGRADSAGTLHFEAEGECAWGRVYARSQRDTPAGPGAAYREKVGGLTVGRQALVAPDTFLGYAFSFESASLDFGQGDGSVTRGMAGAVMKWDLGRMMVAGSLEGGVFSASTVRSFTAGGMTQTATGKPQGEYLAAHLRLNSRTDTGAAFIDPTLDLGLGWMHQRAYSEAGAGAYGMNVAALNELSLSVNPFVSFGRKVTLNGKPGQVSFRLGALGLIGRAPVVQQSFLGGGGGSFAVQGQHSRLFADFGAGLDLQLSEGLSLRTEVDALVASHQTSYGVRMRLNYAF